MKRRKELRGRKLREKRGLMVLERRANGSVLEVEVCDSRVL